MFCTDYRDTHLHMFPVFMVNPRVNPSYLPKPENVRAMTWYEGKEEVYLQDLTRKCTDFNLFKASFDVYFH